MGMTKSGRMRTLFDRIRATIPSSRIASAACGFILLLAATLNGQAPPPLPSANPMSVPQEPAQRAQPTAQPAETPATVPAQEGAPSKPTMSTPRSKPEKDPTLREGDFSIHTVGGEIKEDQLKQMLAGKTLYLRGGYQDNNLEFDEHGRLLSHSAQGSYTLSQIQINKVKLSKKKVELIGDRYALHFLGAAPYDDPTAATDRVKINPKKKGFAFPSIVKRLRSQKTKTRIKAQRRETSIREKRKIRRGRPRRQWCLLRPSPIPLLFNPLRAISRL